MTTSTSQLAKGICRELQTRVSSTTTFTDVRSTRYWNRINISSSKQRELTYNYHLFEDSLNKCRRKAKPKPEIVSLSVCLCKPLATSVIQGFIVLSSNRVLYTQGKPSPTAAKPASNRSCRRPPSGGNQHRPSTYGTPNACP